MNKGDEWLIIKVPRNQRLKYFMVDYCDGDNEDEYHWLEGPYLQKDWTIRDLLAPKMLPVRRMIGRASFITSLANVRYANSLINCTLPMH